MRKRMMIVLMVVLALVVASPAFAQGAGPGQPVGEQQGPGEAPETPGRAPRGSFSPIAEPTRAQAGETVREQIGTGEPVDKALQSQVRLQLCEEGCIEEPVGVAAQFRNWLWRNAPALAQFKWFGVTPFSMSGTAAFEGDDFVFTFEHGNRWADESWTEEPALAITEQTVIKAVYPVTEATAEIIDLDTLKEYLEDCPTADVMVFGYVEDDGDFVATRIQIRVLCALD